MCLKRRKNAGSHQVAGIFFDDRGAATGNGALITADEQLHAWFRSGAQLTIVAASESLLVSGETIARGQYFDVCFVRFHRFWIDLFYVYIINLLKR